MSTSDSDVDPVRVVALWQAAPGREPEVRDVLDELAARSIREPGCLGFEALESRDRAGRFVLLERYAGETGWREHLASEHFSDLVLGRAVPLLTHRDVQVYAPLPSREATP